MKLLEPFRLKNLPLRNRIVMASMGTNLADAQGFVTEETIAYYAERAKGGAGLILTELVTILFPGGSGIERQLSIDDDKYIPGMRRLADEVHRHGARILVQLNHAGSRGKPEVIGGTTPVSASDVPSNIVRLKPRPLTREEIAQLVEAFGQGTRRAREAGFDGIDLHFAHSYLLCQFIAPSTNKRTDEYGGSFENRIRFPLEVLDRCRKEAGDDFVITAKVTGHQYYDGGIGPAECRAFCRRLAENGLDAVQVSAGDPESPIRFPVPSMYDRRGCYVHLAAAVKKAVSIPVIAVGRINTVELADRILTAGKADLIAMGRSFLADPHFPRKAEEKRTGEIRPCVACNQGCRGRDRTRYLAVGCVLNPRTGREKEDPGLLPAAVPKKVLVIGGGPAGMEAARVASLRGHRVTLAEKEGALGGLLRTAARPPGRSEFRRIIAWYTNQLTLAGTEVLLNKKATAEFIRAQAPEVLILATGSHPLPLKIEELQGVSPVPAALVLAGKDKPGPQAAIVGGGGVGLETADLLAGPGRKVTVIEVLAEAGRDIEGSTKKVLLHRLRKKGVQIITSARIQRVTSASIFLSTPGGEREIPFDEPLIDATGYQADNDLFENLTGISELKDLPVFRIGDCISPRQIREAVSEAYQVARNM